MSLLFYSYLFSSLLIFITGLYCLKFTERLHVRERARLFGKLYCNHHIQYLIKHIPIDYFINQTLTILDLVTGFIEGTFDVEPIFKFTQLNHISSQTVDDQVITNENIVTDVNTNKNIVVDVNTNENIVADVNTNENIVANVNNCQDHTDVNNDQIVDINIVASSETKQISDETIVTGVLPIDEKSVEQKNVLNEIDDATNKFIESSDDISIKAIKIKKKSKSKSKPTPPPKKGKRLVLSINR